MYPPPPLSHLSIQTTPTLPAGTDKSYIYIAALHQSFGILASGARPGREVEATHNPRAGTPATININFLKLLSLIPSMS
jgi:hypothetical protein